MPIIRRNNCAYATLGTCYSVWMTVWYAGWNVSFHLHTKQSSTQNNKYQESHKHSCFSWWWAHGRPKHVEIDKHTKKKNVHQFGFIYNIFIDVTQRTTKIKSTAFLCGHSTRTCNKWEAHHVERYIGSRRNKCRCVRGVWSVRSSVVITITVLVYVMSDLILT